MWNPGDAPNRFIEVVTPGDGDGLFRDGADHAALGIEWFDDWTDDLKRRHGLA